jgi:hypothetical protein
MEGAMLTSPLGLIGALAGAIAYGPAPELGRAELAPEVRETIRAACVELYCGHNAVALTDIRAARRQLQAGAQVSAQALSQLDRAAWLVRQDDYVHAEEALQAVLSGAAPHGTERS